MSGSMLDDLDEFFGQDDLEEAERLIGGRKTGGRKTDDLEPSTSGDAPDQGSPVDGNLLEVLEVDGIADHEDATATEATGLADDLDLDATVPVDATGMDEDADDPDEDSDTDDSDDGNADQDGDAAADLENTIGPDAAIGEPDQTQEVDLRQAIKEVVAWAASADRDRVAKLITTLARQAGIDLDGRQGRNRRWR